MAGALARMAPRLAPYVGPAARAAAGYLGYALLDGAIQRVQDWIDGQEWRKGPRHNGLDLPCPVGTAVLSPTDAIVIGQQESEDGGTELFLAGPRLARSDPSDPNRWPRKYAWYARGTPETGRDEVLVDDSGWRFGFSHLSGINVQPPTLVRRGQQIATTGQSGNAKDHPHLHLVTSWLQDGLTDVVTYVDPALLIPGIPATVPVSAIGPGVAVTVCVLKRISSGEQALAKCVVQEFPTGLGVNWAATVQGVTNGR